MRYENLVTQTYTNEDGSEVSLQINTTLLLSIYFEPGYRTGKEDRREKVAYRAFEKKHPFLSKFYNPYSEHWYTHWYRPRVVFNYGSNAASFSFSDNATAEKFHGEMTKKYFGNSDLHVFSFGL